jgi:Na+/H+ antiporter NhaD/arsenite permease-like protein
VSLDLTSTDALLFILTLCPDVIVLFPFNIPFPLPRFLINGVKDVASALRITAPRRADDQPKTWYHFPMNFVTAPIVADIFLLIIGAIGGTEFRGGIVESDNIHPYDIMLFFITLAYIAISIDASGLIRYLAFKVLQWGGNRGHRLFLYLYTFFFVLGSFIGNDPIILSGTAFLAYMTRVANNIVHPRAWLHTQFAVANIASAILVSSNPTNLVLAGAFKIKFIHYTANMVVPTVATAIVLFPFLLYVIFKDDGLIPKRITMHQLDPETLKKKPVNPNIPHAKGSTEEEEDEKAEGEKGKQLSLEEIMNPFLGKWSAGFGGVIMAATLVTLLAINASNQSDVERPVFYVTLPAAVIMFIWDVASGWKDRKKTRMIAKNRQEEFEMKRLEREAQRARQGVNGQGDGRGLGVEQNGKSENQLLARSTGGLSQAPTMNAEDEISKADPAENGPSKGPSFASAMTLQEKNEGSTHSKSSAEVGEVDEEKQPKSAATAVPRKQKTTLVSKLSELHQWLQCTFPTATAVIAHLPFALIPFAFAMFILVQALVTKGWVAVFAYGWDHWVYKTGTVGAIGGMGFLSVILCNVSSLPTVRDLFPNPSVCSLPVPISEPPFYCLV